MMYYQKFVVAVKAKGKVLREFDDIVKLPFGTEYTLLLKNLNTRKALVSVRIDGEDVLDGNNIIIPANSSTELQGFMRGNVADHAFRFIERTEKIESYRGIQPEDGLIEVTYQFEKEYVLPSYKITYTQPSEKWYGSGGYTLTDTDYFNTADESKSSNGMMNSVNCSYFVENNTGITIAGEDRNQVFTHGSIGLLEDEQHTIILKLSGYHKKEKIMMEPMYVRAKITCPTCGTRNHTGHKYCTECGRNLQ